MKTGLLIFSALVLVGCQSGRGPEAEAKKSPVVEAYIEFGGPAQKWVGPGNWIVHVSAKQNPVDVKVALDTPMPQSYTQESARKIASSEGHGSPVPATITASDAHAVAKTKALTFDDIRAQLSGLAVQIAEDEEAASACLNRVRVKLVREDGTTIEKDGCRNAKGWTGRVSALAAEWAR